MESPARDFSKLSRTEWLIITIASIGFLFDTYELLMTPLVAAPAIAELLKVPQNNPLVTEWVGRLLWIAALCGGVFGLLGGWLVDKFGRKKVMAASIFLYSFAPFCAAYSTTLPMFITFRSLTFIGVCVEFVAAITWLAEVFEDKKQREKWLGITQAFASLGGVLVTVMSIWISKHMADLPALSLPAGLGSDAPSSWRFLLLPLQMQPNRVSGEMLFSLIFSFSRLAWLPEYNFRNLTYAMKIIPSNHHFVKPKA